MDALSHVSPFGTRGSKTKMTLKQYQYQSTTSCQKSQLWNPNYRKKGWQCKLTQYSVNLKQQIFQGWPDVRRSIPERTHPFWNFRDELVVEERLILDSHKTVIPVSQKHKFLKDLHIGHFGEEKTPLRVQECIYWPGITGDIKACNIC